MKAEEFKKQFTCLGEHTEKCITFSVPTEKEVTRIERNGKETMKNISYRLQFIDIARFMTRSLSILVNNLTEEIHKIKCKYGHDYKKCKTRRIKYKNYKLLLEYKNFKRNLTKYKLLCCIKNY